MSAAFSPRLLASRAVEKVWGRTALPTPFAGLGPARIGEIWFEPPAELPNVLVKYLFTCEKLSVQVHPSDAQAEVGEAGKEECWLVLHAEPGACLGIGFMHAVTTQEIASAALDGSIERLLAWHPVREGDLFYLPAGTVHALGPGLTLVEVQQNSDTTFRLYDYGRPRELHLERALAVARGEIYGHEHRSSLSMRGKTLIDGPYFRFERIHGEPDEGVAAAFNTPVLALPLEGTVTSFCGAVRAKAGECIIAPRLDVLKFHDADVTLLVREA
ncbi:class I mannose-6-phosphate isomerase [Erythrobacter sp. NFXS35]|uniref:class I mannose-6-phosphate isomerase n=1 Tax=Erythrobacter sp. NFXS35 TaxID=2818436 RepID=UPI0032E02382